MTMIRDRVKPEKKIFARMLRKNPTPSERVLWEYLRRKNLGVKFVRQNVIRGYIVDFYSPKIHLVIEVDGSSHDNRAKYDEKRDRILSEIGIKTLRFTNQEITEWVSLVIGTIRKEVKNRLSYKIVPFHGPIPKEKMSMRGTL